MTVATKNPLPPEPPARRRTYYGATAIIGGAFLAMLAAGLVIAPGPLTQPASVVAPLGAHTADIGLLLAQRHAIYLSPLFRVAARLIAKTGLKAGEYALPARASMKDIIVMMRDGKAVVRLFTVPEGLTSAQIVEMLNEDPALTGNVSPLPAEGALLPETYRYIYGDNRMGLIGRMQKASQEKRAEIWAARDSDLPLRTPDDMVILASIVEKETGRADERPRVAGVFYNRLRLNMRLQSDPTVIYALTGGLHPLARVLTHEDLALVSPINTYTSDGLPPQPICNPGLKALSAVAHPERHGFLYFVADGHGGHAFAADLATQNHNINRWRQLLQSAAPHP